VRAPPTRNPNPPCHGCLHGDGECDHSWTRRSRSRGKISGSYDRDPAFELSMNPLKLRATGQSASLSAELRMSWGAMALDLYWTPMSAAPGADAAPGSLNDHRPAAAAACALSAKIKRVIYLFQSGLRSVGPVSINSPISGIKRGSSWPDSVRDGSAHRHETSGKRTSRRSIDLQVCPARAKRRWLERVLPHHGHDRRRHLLDSLDATEAINQTGDHVSCGPARSSRDGRAWGRGSPTVWAARTAICRRSSCFFLAVNRIAAVRSAMGQRIPSHAISRGQATWRKEPVLYLDNPAGCTRPIAGRMLDDIAVYRRPASARPATPNS